MPGSFRTVFSILCAQAAQVIPLILSTWFIS
jgi:hypothetical protein